MSIDGTVVFSDGSRKLPMGHVDLEGQQIVLNKRIHGVHVRARLAVEEIVAVLDPAGTKFRRVGTAA